MRNRNIRNFCQQKGSPETSLHKKVKSGGVLVLIDDDTIMSYSSIDSDIELSVLYDKDLMSDEITDPELKELLLNENSNVHGIDVINNSIHSENELSYGDKPLNDISHFVCKKLTDDKKMHLLQNVWKPDEGSIFPRNQTNKCFQLHWLNQFSWFVYSNILDGAFCLYCVLFGTQTGGNSNTEEVFDRAIY